MNISINGISLEQYNATNNQFEELKFSIENFEPISYNQFDFLGEEASILGDMIKGSVKATKGSVKMGIQGVKAANKQWSNIKNKWSQIKPQIIKLLKQFAMGLQNLWHKFLQYDKKYKELSKKINNIIQFSVNQMQQMPNVKFYYHNFNARLLKGLVDLVANWGLFYVCITDGFKGKKSGVFTGNPLPEPENVAEAIKKNDLNGLKSMVQDFSEGIGRLNSQGELTLGLVLDRMFDWDLIANFPNERRKDANEGKITLSEYIKLAILGPTIEKEYNNENKDEFVRDMTGGNDSYLRLVASILNNDILADALKKGGASTKKGTDLMIKGMEQVMKNAEVQDKINASKKEQAEKQKADMDKQRNADKAIKEEAKEEGIDMSKAQNFGSVSQTVSNIAGDNQNNGPEDTIASLAELYSKNYVVFTTKLSNTYGNLVRGMLAATYDIISEAGTIISTIEASANRTKTL